MAAGKYNTTMEQGATFKRTFEVNDANGDPIDLTGYTFAGQMRKLPKDTGTPIATFTAVLGASVNKINVSLTNTQTSAVPVVADAKDPVKATRYYYDIEMTAPDTTVTRLVEGYIDVSPEVTK